VGSAIVWTVAAQAGFAASPELPTSLLSTSNMWLLARAMADNSKRLNWAQNTKITAGGARTS
jgi:hypothetical protein